MDNAEELEMEADEGALHHLLAREQYGLTCKVSVAMDTNINVKAVTSTHVETNSNSDWLVASSLTNHDIHIYKGENLHKVTVLRGHQNTITGLKFSNKNENILYSSSLDGTVRVWDLRENKTVSQFQDDTKEKLKPLCSFDLNCDETYLCAGSELVITDAYLLFWDLKKSKLLGGYWESHSDDVTQIAFHPQRPTTMATGATDGLINIFDISETDEDDALLTTLNTESSVDVIKWHQDEERISCLTHIETLQLWDTEEGKILETYDRESIAKEFKIESPPKRFLNLVKNSKPGPPALITALKGDSALLMELCDESWQVHTLLTGVHSSPIICAHWDVENEWAITADESALLCHWKKGAQPPKSEPKDNFTIKKAFSKVQNRKNPY